MFYKIIHKITTRNQRPCINSGEYCREHSQFFSIHNIIIFNFIFYQRSCMTLLFRTKKKKKKKNNKNPLYLKCARNHHDFESTSRHWIQQFQYSILTRYTHISSICLNAFLSHWSSRSHTKRRSTNASESLLQPYSINECKTVFYNIF